jgi:hypothetical protein
MTEATVIKSRMTEITLTVPAIGQNAGDEAVAKAGDSARAAGLHYISDDEPGITRHRAGAGFFYRSPDGIRRLTIRISQQLAAMRKDESNIVITRISSPFAMPKNMSI